MTPDKVRGILTRYDQMLDGYPAIRDTSMPRSYMRWICRQGISMLDEAAFNPGPDTDHLILEASQWLGFVQGFFWGSGEYTVEEMRDHEREAEVVKV